MGRLGVKSLKCISRVLHIKGPVQDLAAISSNITCSEITDCSTLQYLKHVSSAVLWCDHEVNVSLVPQKYRVGYINHHPSIDQVESLFRV